MTVPVLKPKVVNHGPVTPPPAKERRERMKDRELTDLVNKIESLPAEEKKALLEHWCKSCHDFIGDDKDWSGQNYCSQCSPDPAE